MKLFIRLTVLLILLVAAYNIWVVTGIPPTDDVLVKTSIQSSEWVTIGTDSGKGNIIGIQPNFTALNYANEPTFKESIRPYLQIAKAQNLLNNKTIVVFPEHIGSGLIAFEEKESLYKEPTMSGAINALIKANLFKFSLAYITAPKATNKTNYAVFAMKAKQITEVYNRVFSTLAKEFSVTIVAGSIAIPNPSISTTKQLVSGKGDIYNTGVIFNPDGTVLAPLNKIISPINTTSTFDFSANSRVINSTNSIILSFSGTLWDQQSPGKLMANINNTTTILPAIAKARIVNFWLN